jgi:hypothetical protein
MEIGLVHAGVRARESRRPGGRGAVTCASDFDVATNPATLRTLVAGADAGTRQRRAAD